MKLVQHYRTLGLRRNASFEEVKRAYRQLVRKYHPDVNQDQAAVDRFIQVNAAYTALCEALQKKSSSSQQDLDKAVNHNHGSSRSVSVETSASERLNIDDLKRKLEKMGIGNFPKDQQVPAQQEFKQSSHQHHRIEVEQAANEAGQTAQESEHTAHTVEDRSQQSEQKVERSHAQSFTNDGSISEQDFNLKKDAYEQLKVLLRQQKFPRAIALVEGLAHRMPTDVEINQWQAIVYQRWGRQLISQGQFQKSRIYLRKALQTDPNNPSLTNEVERDLGLLKHLQAAEATL